MHKRVNQVTIKSIIKYSLNTITKHQAIEQNGMQLIMKVSR